MELRPFEPGASKEERWGLLNLALAELLVLRDRVARLENPETGRKLPVIDRMVHDWKPLGDGERFWTNPGGYTVPLAQVPKEILEAHGRHAEDEIAED